MPSENCAFTTHVDPVSPPKILTSKLVEAPGTAPGSVTLILQNLYRHSWFPNPANIALSRRQWKSARCCIQVTDVFAKGDATR